MPEFDGLKLLVQFAYNQGNLQNVSNKTGVPKKVIMGWLLDDKKLSKKHRKKLSKGIDPRYTGKVTVTTRPIKDVKNENETSN